MVTRKRPSDLKDPMAKVRLSVIKVICFNIKIRGGLDSRNSDGYISDIRAISPSSVQEYE